MIEKPTFFIDSNTLKSYIGILDNTSYNLDNYNINFDHIYDVIENGSKIEGDTAYKIIELFNDYYNQNYGINDIFDYRMIIQLKTILFKNYKIYNKFVEILENKDFKISGYGIKPSQITDKINTGSKMQYKTALIMLDIFNDYFETDYKIEDIFDIQMLINYKPAYNEVEYSYENDNLSISNGLDKIFESFKNAYEKLLGTFKVKKQNGGFATKNNDKNQLIIYMLIIIFIYINIQFIIPYFLNK